MAYGRLIPYLPVRDLLSACLHLPEPTDGETLCLRLTEALQALDAALVPSLPALLALLDVPSDDPRWHALDPRQRRQQTLDAVKHLLLRASQHQPLLVIIEDAQWLDSETQALLDRLVDSLPTARILLLVSYRPEYQHGWGSKTSYTQLRLDPLPLASTEDLLQALLGDDASLVPVKRLLIARTGGNPFFLEESLQALMETDVLVGAPGAYRLMQAVPTIQIPTTVQAVLAARIDRLPPEEKHLLQTAAVIGTEVPLPLLHAVAELPEAALHGGLVHLQATEFLYETRLFPAHEYTFKHALTQEVAYNSLLRERRRVLHTRIVEVIEVLAGDRMAEQAERLVQHALRGEVWDKAVTYCQQAGARAFDRAAFREAVTAYEQALRALAYLPEDGDTRVLAIELRLALADTLRGEFRRGHALLGEAVALARALNDRGRLGRVLAELSQARMVIGDFDGAMAAGQEAFDLTSALGDRAMQYQASHRLGQVCYASGAYGRAAELLRLSVEAAEREAGTFSITARIEARTVLVLTLSDLGAFAEGRCYGEEALRLAILEGRNETPAKACSRLGRLYLAQGDLVPAIRVLEQGLALCRASGDWNLFRPTVASLGYAYALQGRLAEGRTLLEEGIQEGIRRGEVGNHACWVAWLSEVCRLAGHDEEAWQHARQALDLARQIKNRGDEVRALHQLGTLYAHTAPSNIAQAQAHYQQALALAEEIGMCPLQAHCHHGLGTLYAQTGQRERSRAALSRAIELYRSMDMTFWLPQAETALARVL
jgi:predicted ATPase